MKRASYLAALRCLALATTVGLAVVATAQSGYRYTQGGTSGTSSGPDRGPVRMARISYIAGSTSWRAAADGGWSTASRNLPIRQGAEFSVNPGSRLELQFDDGSRLRLGDNAVASLLTMYADSNGEFTEIKLSGGLASLTLTNKDSEYQIDTPEVSIKAYGPARIRIGCGGDVEVACRKGEARIEGNQGVATLTTGQYCDITVGTGPYRISALPPEDSWDRFCDNRDAIYDHPSAYVPSSVALVSGDLNGCGTWRANVHYGHVWYPTVTYAGWRPYHDGHWVWVDPFGWTWCGDESWGWAPYHYGTWIHDGYGWGWCPGPTYQYWSPAVVAFSTYNGAVAWCPLAPTEVLYPPTLSIGFGLGNWSLLFSIGGCACYYPFGATYCVGRPWGNVYVNGFFGGGFSAGLVAGVYGGGGRYWSSTRFNPSFGRSAFAITRTTTAGFAGRGRFQSGTASDAAIFSRGRSMVAANGRNPISGPASVRPSRASTTTSRSFTASRPNAAVAGRSVFRSTLPGSIARTSSPAGLTRQPSSRTAMTTRVGSTRNIGGSRTSGAAASRYDRFNSVSRVNRRTAGSTRNSTSSYARSGSSAHSSSSFARTRSTASPSRTRSSSSYARSRASSSYSRPRSASSYSRPRSSSSYSRPRSSSSYSRPRSSSGSRTRSSGGRASNFSRSSSSSIRSSGSYARSFGNSSRSFGGSSYSHGSGDMSRSFGGSSYSRGNGGMSRSFGGSSYSRGNGGMSRGFGGSSYSRGSGGMSRGGGGTARGGSRRGHGG